MQWVPLPNRSFVKKAFPVRKSPYLKFFISNKKTKGAIAKKEIARVLVEFVVDKDLSLRRIRFSDELKGINEELHEDVLLRLDADCLLMAETLSTLQTAVAKTFGGISE